MLDSMCCVQTFAGECVSQEFDLSVKRSGQLLLLLLLSLQ